MDNQRDMDFARIFEALPGRRLVLSPHLEIRAASLAFLEASGARRDQLLGRPVLDIYGAGPHGDFARDLSDSLARVLDTGLAQAVMAPGGDRRLANNVPVHGPSGEVLWIIHEMEDAAGAQGRDDHRQRLASIVTSSHDAIIGKTLDGLVTSWNRAAEESFGYAADEVIGRRIAILFPPDRLAEEDMIVERLGRGERVEHYETVRRHKDGRDILVSLSVSPIHDDRGQVVGASKIVRDVTEQKRVQARMDELQAELLHVSRLNDMGQMASAFAHELNQPLSAVGTYVHAVRRLIDSGDLVRAREGCDRAADQVARTAEVIRRLRDFVKKDKGAQQREALAPVIEEASALARVAAGSQGVVFTHRFSPDAASAVIDRVQVQQVIVNLVRNSIEATAGGAKREIVIATERTGAGTVDISVSDTGPGVSPEIRERLFQPFVTTKASGMGVGLALCRAIVEAHGGRIWADDGPAGGAVFRFTVPVADEVLG